MSDPAVPGAQFFERYGVEELARRGSAKWVRQDPDSLAAGTAETDFPLPPLVREALADLVERSDLGYPSEALRSRVRAAFAERWQVRHGVRLDPARSVLATDVMQAINLCLASCSPPGCAVAMLTPAYPPFFSAVGGTGRRLVACDLCRTPEGYRLDAQALDAAVAGSGARVLLLCNPHNPTGRVFERHELEAVAELACRHGLLVLADEVHADLVLDGRHLPITALGEEIAERTVTISSASKAFNLAGLRCAIAAFGSQRLFDAYTTVPELQRGSVSLPGLVATLVAYEGCDPYLEGLIGYLRGNRDAVAARIAGELPAAVHHRPQGTYLAWIDLRPLGLGDDPATRLARAGIVLAAGPHFGEAGRGHVRLNFATPRPVLDELLARLVAGCRQAARSD